MTDENQLNELDIIRQLGRENQFPSSTINKLIRRQQRNTTFINLKKDQVVENTTTYRKFTYQGNINNKIKKVLRKHKIICATRQPNTLINQLRNGKDKTNKLDKSGVYALKCDDCEAVYIGETGRKLRTRIQEHLKDNRFSNFGKHLYTNKHTFKNPDNVKLIHQEQKGHKLLLLEAWEIDKQIKLNPNILNEQVDLCYKPLFKYLNQRPP